MSRFEKLFSVALLILFGAVAALFVFNLRIKNIQDLQTVIGGIEDLDSNTLASDSALSNSAESDKNLAQENNITHQSSISQSAAIEELSQRIDKLEASSSTLLKRIEKLENNSGKSPAVSAVTGAGSNNTTTFQKQLFYLGSASTNNTNWTESGVEIKLNSDDYPDSVNAYFEVGMSIVGGEAWARLINKTTGAIMAITEVSHSTSTTTWKTSPSFKLFTGNNIYALQIKSSSGETANFSGARIVLE